jgi:hypothetical protein
MQNCFYWIFTALFAGFGCTASVLSSLIAAGLGLGLGSSSLFGGDCRGRLKIDPIRYTKLLYLRHLLLSLECRITASREWTTKSP